MHHTVCVALQHGSVVSVSVPAEPKIGVIFVSLPVNIWEQTDLQPHGHSERCDFIVHCSSSTPVFLLILKGVPFRIGETCLNSALFKSE